MKYKILLSIIIIVSFVLFLAVNIPSPIKIEGDGIFYYSYVRSAVFDRDFDFKNELEYFSAYDFHSKRILDEGVVTGVGKISNPYAYGASLLWLPFVFVASLITKVFGFVLDGYSLPYVWAINFSGWLFGVLALVLIYLNLKKIFSEHVSLISTIGIYLATPFVYYQIFEPSMAHMASLFVVALFLNLLLKIWKGERINNYIWALVIFLMIAVRWQNAIFLIAVLPLAWQKIKGRKFLLYTIVPVVLFGISQAMIWKYLYGQYLLMPQGQGFVGLQFHGLYTLFSSNRGLIFWSPVIAFSFFGFYYLYQKSRALFFGVLSVFALQWILNSSLADLGGGDAFGARRFVETLPFLALALSAFIEHIRKKKIIWIIVGILILFNLILIEGYRRGVILHSGELFWF